MKLGLSHTTLARRLKGLSFSELEQFTLDIRRRCVLRLPEADAQSVTNERLEQWENRFSLTPKRGKRKDAR